MSSTAVLWCCVALCCVVAAFVSYCFGLFAFVVSLCCVEGGVALRSIVSADLVSVPRTGSLWCNNNCWS